MRASTFLIALGFIGTSLAAPTPLAQPQPVSPILFAKDPLAIHKRAVVPDVAAPAVEAEEVAADDVSEVEVEVASASSSSLSPASSSSSAIASTSIESAVAVAVPEPTAVSAESSAVSAAVQPEAESAAETQHDEPCVSICGVQRVEGAKSEREALCSVMGLQATLSCAKCIDETWPETTWEDSAMAEYERIVSACDDSPQTAFRRNQ